MGRGYLIGLLFGTVVAVLGLLSIGLVATPGRAPGPVEVAISPEPAGAPPAGQEQPDIAAAALPEDAAMVQPEPAAEAAEPAPAPTASAETPVVMAETPAAVEPSDPGPPAEAPVVLPATPSTEAPAPDAAPRVEAGEAGTATDVTAGETVVDNSAAIFAALSEALAEAEKAAQAARTEAPAPPPATTAPSAPPVASALPAGPADAPAEEAAPVLPSGADEAPPMVALPAVAEPAEAAPEVAIDAAPAASPQGAETVPTVPAAPDLPLVIAEAPASEALPPATTGSQPALAAPAATGIAPIVPPTAAPRIVPEPEPEPQPEPQPEPEPIPEGIPEAAGETDDTEIADAAPAAEDGPLTEAPVIIDIAPRAPLGAANAPQPGFGGGVAGVKINRLPRIGDEVASAETLPGAAIPGASPDVPVVEDPGASPAGADALRHRAAFANPDARPVVSVLLTDIGPGAGGVDPERLARLGAPVTIAIDPQSDGAAGRAAALRLGGHEIAILAPDLPAGATPSDIEVSYQAFAAALPEAVALIGDPDAGFLRDRRQAQHLVALLASDGRAIITYPRGLDPAGQAARGLGLPAATVDRVLDANGETTDAILRSLERAAFDASRRPGVVVVGTTAAETVMALEDWIASGGKGTVIGPVSATLVAQ